MVELDKPNRHDLQQCLAESGCCDRCLQRFRSFVDFACDPIDDDDRPENQEMKSLTSSPCFVCLGILEDKQLNKLTTFVQDKIKEANYESPHFVLSLVTVQIIEIRQILLGLWLQEKFPSLSFTHLMEESAPVKQILKDDLVSALPTMLQLEYRSNSCFDVKLEIQVSDAGSDFFHTLEILDDEQFVMKTKRQKRAKKTLSQIFSKKTVTAFFSKHSTKTLEGKFPFPPHAGVENPEEPFVYLLSLEQEPVFIGGRYNKYARDLPQTPWILDGVRMKESSVEELIVDPIKELILADSFKFSSSGREDIDVRCLGDGRPFVVECLNPRQLTLSEEAFRKLEAKINGLSAEKIRVKNLAMVSGRETAYLRKMENKKSKHYTALCHSVQKLTENDVKAVNEVKDLVIQQKTPLRVLHRRPLAVRPRRISSIEDSIVLVDDHHIRIGLETDAGLYIKEFVHGDLGRTQPNLKEILNKEVDILNLDVEKIVIEWPLPPGTILEDDDGEAADEIVEHSDSSTSGDELDS